MDARTGLAAFRIAVLILATGLVILPFQRPGSAESVVNVMAIFVGTVFVGIVLLAARLSSPRLPPATRDKTAAPRSNTSNEDPGRVQ
jgi:hypothetical protein